ncbi:MAG: sulfite exporter TauE/SafE family protein [Flavobacteriales bacterium]
MILLGYILAIIVGILLGVFGGGGTILTVPILVYIMGVDAVSATAYSLFIVGITALIGTLRYYQNKLIDFKIGILFAIPSFLGVFISRIYFLPKIPETLTLLDYLVVGKDKLILLLFALIMLLSAFSMIFSWRPKQTNSNTKLSFILLDGLVVGILTGIIGAGGGFIIVPALLLLSNIDVKQAIGTSLFIITVKSLLGFSGDLTKPLDWELMLLFSLLSVTGVFIGIYLSKHIKSSYLKKSFGVFILLMSIIILIKEIIFL